ncbi:hypothetical protein PJ267_17010 [Arthrobacter sp. OVS8]|nr:hypothetical protein PJ267_17010 [Arthrobacter sp. OVS8]
MNTLTTLERRGMAAISTPGGKMLIVAADQRNGMKAVMNDAPDGPNSITAQQLSDAKADLVRYLGNAAPAILLDPEVALPRVADEGVLSRDTALVVGLDASGFETVDGLRYTKFVPGMTPHKARELGGDVAKMLWYMRPDLQDAGSRVADEIRELVKACTDEGLLLIVEILVYRLEGESEEAYAAAFPVSLPSLHGSPSNAAPRCSSCSTRDLPRPAPRSLRRQPACRGPSCPRG